MIEVTCAIIKAEDLTLCAQRSEAMNQPLVWEFPGGKIEKGETAEQCIIREIKEELSIDIRVVKQLNSHTHAYSSENIIKLIPFICEVIGGELIKTEHKQIKWLLKKDLLKLNWADADLPIVNEYLNIEGE